MIEAVIIILTGFFLFCYIFWKAIEFECGVYSYKPEKKITPAYTVLTVKNNEECIEGVIYSMIKEIQINKDNPPFQNILVIDVGSTDNTAKILEKISKKYEFIHIIHGNSYIDMVGQ